MTRSTKAISAPPQPWKARERPPRRVERDPSVGAAGGFRSFTGVVEGTGPSSSAPASASAAPASSLRATIR